LNLLLIIAGAGLILAAGLILKGRKNQADRNARYRAPKTSLKLDRASAGLAGRSGGPSPILSKSRPSSPAAPIMLGVGLVVLSLWLAAAYLRPSADSAEAGTEAARAASPPFQTAQVGTLAGRLNITEPPAPETTDQAPAIAPSAGEALAAALSQTAAAQAEGSALSQVGLMPTTSRSTTTTFTTAPKPADRPAAETKPASAAAPKPDQAPPPPSPPASPPADSNLVRALADPPGGGAAPSGTGAPPAAIGGGRSGILSGTAGFTVHLGSFVDQANAEKFRAKLAAAGEPAAISEINIDGRRWYRVLSGRFDTRTAADAHGRDLRRRGLTDDTPFIVKPVNSE
jgi:cell division protein FtsN